MSTNQDLQQRNKDVVRRFNEEVIDKGDAAAFASLMADGFKNRMVPAGMPDGPEGMWHFFQSVLRPAFPDLSVEIHEQLVDGDRVITRKTIRGTHRGELFDIPPTGRTVAISVIDIVRIEDGRYAEHWGVSTFGEVLAQLARPATA